jgi:hypothetical protein
MAKMTEEEAWELDERWTKDPPDIDTSRPGFFAKRQAAKAQDARMVTLDGVTANYLLTKAIQTRKTPATLIAELVRKSVAAAAL